MKDPSLDPQLGAVGIALNTTASILNPFGDRLRHRPTHTAFCWDGKPKKDKGRAAKPSNYHEGRQLYCELLTEAIGTVHFTPEYEADDAVASYAFQLSAKPDVEQVYVVSGDKDLEQVVSEKVAVYSTNEKCLLSMAAILEYWHIKDPRQVSVALAILGDSADLVPGIRMWGRKKVKKLFEGVKETDDLVTVVDHVSSFMNPEQRQIFTEGLELTLLDVGIRVPEPTPIVIGGREAFQRLDLSRIWRAFNVGGPEDGVDEI